MSRNPNIACSICQTIIYRRPRDIDKSKSGNVFCSKACYGLGTRTLKDRECDHCNKVYRPVHASSKYCSKSCSTKQSRKGERGIGKNRSQSRLIKLKELFNFDSCMVEGCTYNITYDIHRVVEGKDGGEYVVGNMFAICPNHHAEVTRRIITLVKVNDYTLKAEAGTRMEGNSLLKSGA